MSAFFHINDYYAYVNAHLTDNSNTYSNSKNAF